MSFTTHSSSSTIGQLVVEEPRRARIFERHGIDYCCDGKKTLEEACTKRGLDPKSVQAELAAIDNEPMADDKLDWMAMPLSSIVDHIVVRHHDLMRAELPRAAALVSKVARAHGHNRPELLELERIFASFAGELNLHMQKEEVVLFPWIRGLEAGRDGVKGMNFTEPIRCMMREHDDAGESLRRMRELTGGFEPAPDACGTFRVMLSALKGIEADMHTHVHLENSVLFPRALELESSRVCGSGCSCSCRIAPSK